MTQWELGDTWKLGTEVHGFLDLNLSRVAVFRLMYISEAEERKTVNETIPFNWQAYMNTCPTSYVWYANRNVYFNEDVRLDATESDIVFHDGLAAPV